MPAETKGLFKATSFPNLWGHVDFQCTGLGEEGTPFLPLLHLTSHRNLTHFYISRMASQSLTWADAPLSQSVKAACTLPFLGAPGGSDGHPMGAADLRKETPGYAGSLLKSITHDMPAPCQRSRNRLWKYSFD